MSTVTLNDLQEQRDSAADLAISLAAAEGFDPDAPTPEFTEAQSRAENLGKRVDILADAMQARASANRVTVAASTTVATRSESRVPSTLGDAFVDSGEFRNYQGRGTSSRATVATNGLNVRAVINTGEDPGAAFIVPDTSFGGKTPPRLQNPLLRIMNSVQVSSGSVEWVEYPAQAPLAAVVPEMELKPEAILTASSVAKSLETIAHHVIVTRQALEDSSMLRDWINGNLVRGVADKLESRAAEELIAGTFAAAEGESLMAAIRVGYGMVQSAGYTPNTLVLNPADYAELDLAVFAATGSPASSTSFWGLTPVAVGAVPAGTAYVGDFTAGMTFFYRAGTDVFISDSHSDFFLRNQFVVLAERRALPAVITPEAIVSCAVTVPPATARK